MQIFPARMFAKKMFPVRMFEQKIFTREYIFWLSLVGFLLFPLVLWSQDGDGKVASDGIAKGSIAEIRYIDRLSQKKETTAEDFLIVYTLQQGDNYQKFSYERKALAQKGYVDEDQLVAKDSPLGRQEVAAILARKLDLRDSLFYLITGWERYAYRACVAAGIMSHGQNPYAVLTGAELIEINRLAHKE